MVTDEPLDPQLTSSLLGILAVLEGQARIGELPLNIVLRLRQRLVGTGQLPARGASGEDLADALSALNQSLRTHERPDWVDQPLDAPLLVNILTFPARAEAEAFAEEMREQDKDVDPPVHEPAFQRWTVVIHHSDRASATPGMEFHAATAHGGQHLGAF